MKTYIFRVEGVAQGSPDPTPEEAQVLAEEFAKSLDSDMVMVIGGGGTMDAILDTLLSAGFGGVEVFQVPNQNAGQEFLEWLRENPLPSQEVLAARRAMMGYNRSAPFSFTGLDYTSVGRETPNWPRATTTCDKPQGPPVKLMTDQAAGIEPPYSETYQRSVRGLSMGCEVDDPVCSICEDQEGGEG